MTLWSSNILTRIWRTWISYKINHSDNKSTNNAFKYVLLNVKFASRSKWTSLIWILCTSHFNWTTNIILLEVPIFMIKSFFYNSYSILQQVWLTTIDFWNSEEIKNLNFCEGEFSNFWFQNYCRKNLSHKRRCVFPVFRMGQYRVKGHLNHTPQFKIYISHMFDSYNCRKRLEFDIFYDRIIFKLSYLNYQRVQKLKGSGIKFSKIAK